jgi:regulator of nucleoside diphosphate kinase
MKARQMLVTAHDARRLIELMVRSEGSHGPDRDHLEALAEKLERAVVVPPEAVPPDVVTIHSEVRIHHLDSDTVATYTLAYPGRREAANAVSVLAPLGTAMLGCREGDEVDWQAPGGRKRFAVLEVIHQPEAAARELIASREAGHTAAAE